MKEDIENKNTINLFGERLKSVVGSFSHDFISHDIAHCYRSDCPVCNECHRYLMYNRAQVVGSKRVPYIDIVDIPDNEVGENCGLF